MDRIREVKKELASVLRELYELETSTQSRSHAGPALTMRSLRRKKDRLETEIQDLQTRLEDAK